MTTSPSRTGAAGAVSMPARRPRAPLALLAAGNAGTLTSDNNNCGGLWECSMYFWPFLFFFPFCFYGASSPTVGDFRSPHVHSTSPTNTTTYCSAHPAPPANPAPVPPPPPTAQTTQHRAPM
jgi:hypothetical protein